MNPDFDVEDKLHNIVVKFVQTSLPEAKKPYNLRAAHQTVLDIHGIASKAAVYNINTNPKVIEDGFNAAIKLIYYLSADGFKIKTPLFNLWMRIPGEYLGSETALAEGVHPVARLQISSRYRKYLREKVKLCFAGIDHNEGFITEARDESTGCINQMVTPGSILTIHGKGLKIDSDAESEVDSGVFFLPSEGEPIKAPVVSLNEPKRLMVLVPNQLVPGTSYAIAVQTMSSVRNGGRLQKKMRGIQSEFRLLA